MTNIVLQRLHNQQLVGTKLQSPTEVVAWFGAVQAQEYALAKWALSLRLPGVTDADIEQAFTDGAILRTHVMRPTWHFVAPFDIRWLLALTAPRVNQVNAYMYRQLELDETIFAQSNTIIASALEGSKYLTRSELGSVLAQAGIVAEGIRLGYIVHRAELDAVVCSGPRRGKQFTYALLDERAPQAKVLGRDEALAELTKRFFTSHGPAMINDFAWWSGLTVADVKDGLEMVKPNIIREVIDGKEYYLSSSAPDIQDMPLTVFLLPVYDEFGIAYKDYSGMFDPAHTERVTGDSFTSNIVINSQITGTWKRTVNKDSVLIETHRFRSLTASEEDALVAAIQRFGDFLDMPVTLA
ncbi:MAG: winged helix DNA-binding domain-containing protein [Chloroflexi bacterium]|nr:winged helix DNA-binding domain-containing protein [Chloroflexota bacterium]